MERPSRRILLVDCDQFFVQCARLADPEGAGKQDLLLVGGTKEGRGVVTSASYATRAFGVRSGMPTGQALALCPQAMVAPVPGRVCGERSAAVREVLKRFTPVVEPASIDEAYLDLTGTERLYHGESLADTAKRIQADVLRDTEIQVSLGGGTSKIVAKLAASWAKPAGVFIVEPGEEESFMRRHELADIPGVGPVSAASLRRYGLVRVDDVLAMDEASLKQVIGDRHGAWLHARARGLDGGHVDPVHVARSMSRDETFSHDIDDDSTLARELRRLIRRLGQSLREDGTRARTITVRLRDRDFRTRQASFTVAEPIETDAAIYEVARPLLLRLRKDRPIPARLIGVSASNLMEKQEQSQLGLFAEKKLESDRDRTISRVTDELRDRFGGNAIGPADLMDRREREGLGGWRKREDEE
jgi:DNA polymerase IV